MIRENDHSLDIKQLRPRVVYDNRRRKVPKNKQTNKQQAWVLLPETLGMDMKQVSTPVCRFLFLLGLPDNQTMLTSPFLQVVVYSLVFQLVSLNVCSVICFEGPVCNI